MGIIGTVGSIAAFYVAYVSEIEFIHIRAVFMELGLSYHQQIKLQIYPNW